MSRTGDSPTSDASRFGAATDGSAADGSAPTAAGGDEPSLPGSEAERLKQENDSAPVSTASPPALPLTPAEPTLVLPEELRFSKIEAGGLDWCGLTQPEADLVCVSEGVAEVVKTGPLLDFGFSQESQLTTLCTVAQDGKLSCNSELLDTPPVTSVEVGFLVVCAHSDDGIVCPLLSGVTWRSSPPEVGSSFSIQGLSLCGAAEGLHARCLDRAGNALLPAGGHFTAVAATGVGACAALLGGPVSEGADAELLGRSQVVCFDDKGGHEVVLAGTFSQLAADLDGDGCAFGGAQDAEPSILCWGKHAGSIPVGVNGRPAQLSVSTQQVCALWDSGKVDCFRSLGP